MLAGADIIEWFADEGRRVYGRIVPLAQGPDGAPDGAEGPGAARVRAFTPWNFPINQVVRKMARRWRPAAP